MLLYLIKHSRPDIANCVQELTKVLDGASPAAYKEMLRVIKYVLDTPNYALKLAPILSDECWKVVAYSDSDFATDSETRRSTFGFILYLCGAPISWKSKAQKTVTLSSTEAEYVARSETAKEVKFIHQVLTGMGIKVKLPIAIRVDNVGTIFMAENIAISQRTKHIDIRFKFVNEYVKDGFVKIIFVGTKENRADIFTKNLNGELQDKHAMTFMENKNIIEEKKRKGVGGYIIFPQ